jgi:hypothetical protein
MVDPLAIAIPRPLQFMVLDVGRSSALRWHCLFPFLTPALRKTIKSKTKTKKLE